jgi:NhaP-type Na+/H+ and K+/H+ antiporter
MSLPVFIVFRVMKYVYSIAEAISVTGEISIYVASVLLN